MKLYTFTKKDSDEIITQVRADNHDQAVAIVGLPWDTSFYSETLNLGPEAEGEE